LSSDRIIDILGRAAREEITGGRTYDFVIGECARGAVDALLTFNRRHFDPAPAGVEVIEPSR
jgi:hypothetical protein